MASPETGKHHTESSVFSQTASPGALSTIRMLSVAAAILAYAGLFIAFFHWHNFGMAVAAMLPVAVAAWAYGAKGGIIAALLSLPANIFMCQVLGADWMERMFRKGMGLEGTFGFIIAGFVIGRFSDLGTRLKNEFQLRLIAERELKVHRNNLEELVRSKTAELSATNSELLAMNRDLSASRNALKASQEHFQAIAETIPEAIISTDASMKVAYWNTAAEKMFGYSADEILGRSNELLMPAEEQARQSDFLCPPADRQVISDLHLESVARRKDGSLFPVSLAFAHWQEGAQDFVTALVQDISQRKKAEAMLQESRDFLQTIFKASPDIIIVTDTGGMVTAVNDAVYTILGYRPEELIGKSTALLTPEFQAHRESGLHMISALEQPGCIKDFELILRKKNGIPCFVECNAILLGEKKNMGSLSVLRDITERKKTEQQLRQTLKMESIGTLASGIAHDFNNILGAIIGYGELALDEAGQQGDLQEHLKEVLTAAARARELIKQIMFFSRKNEQSMVPLRLSAIIDEALKLLRPTIPATIEIHKNYTAVPDRITGDPIQIQQVILNLCSNAAQAMLKNGGMLSLETNRIEVQARASGTPSGCAPGTYIGLTVRDTGTGIDPQILSRIFEPFFTTKEAGKGTGMGLAVVHGIVKSHGGAVEVESVPGRGTVMHVLLPATDHVENTQEALPQSGWRGSERIMFIDDEKALVDIVHKMLSPLGYRVTALASSTEALEVFGRSPLEYDLVITDQSMPGISGHELASRFWQLRPELPVLLCTGYSDLISKEQALQQGFKAYLIKPLSRDMLVRSIREALEAR